MSDTNQCSICSSIPPHDVCAGKDAEMMGGVCARLATYETAKLPQTWQQKVRQFDAGHITTNADIQAAMQEQIDALSSYAARLACDLLMLNGMIQRAAREAEGYIGAVHKAEKERS